ncbi:TPA: hypothetical protein QDB03_006066 [Burkholderia vietnamiensis]|nr:hypothetical protein [Burkholderia vietnamiensis]
MNAAYRWIGDSIGCSDGPAIVTLESNSGRLVDATVEQALSMAHQIDRYGLYRIASAFDFLANQDGILSELDISAWRAAEAQVTGLLERGRQAAEVSLN